MTAAAPQASTNCCACGLAFRDLTDAQTGLDQKCRAALDYRRISSLSEAERGEANWAIHAIAQNSLRGGNLRNAIFRLYELGFVELSKRIERRVGKETIPEEARVAAPGPTQQEIALAEAAVVPVGNLRPLTFSPTDHQHMALDLVRRLKAKEGYGVGVVVGYAGTGKTASIQFIAHEHGEPLVITPTGKAALRVREATGVHAMTIHRWIYAPTEDPKTGAVKFQRRTAEEVEALIPRSRLVVLDESSMVGPEVWHDVRTVCEHHGLKLVCIGDGFQLPPVQPPKSAPFSILVPEFAQQLSAERVEMTEVLRQAQDSPIIRASLALRQGRGRKAFKELTEVPTSNLANVCLAVHQQGGVTICHRNVTRFYLNAGIRRMLGVYDELPVAGEPLMVLKNAYEIGVVNGETIAFPGWETAPENHDRVFDKWNNIEETARFGSIVIPREDADGKVLRATIALEELHGRLTAGPKAISIAAGKWARLHGVYTGDNLAPHCHVNFGYAYTAHKSQGSQWPYTLVCIEPSIRLDEDDGRRWCYTALTRASLACAIHWGNVS
jgi:hypothetical protein